jgi:hypothetical protein
LAGPTDLLAAAMAKPKHPRLPAPKGPSRHQTADYDSPWKEALDRYFQFFMAFFFPQAHADIDWARGYEMLDKELQQVVRRARQGRRYVDKLVKVWLRDGAEQWLLIHVEVQTTREGGFPRRMYVYNTRLFDRYDREVISLAVLADDNPGWRPSRFGYNRWGFRTGIEFPVVKLLDYAPRADALEADPNPFATLVLAHVKTLETRQAPESRRAWKVRLVKGLYERGFSAEDVRQLFRFIDWIMDLPEAEERRFWHEVDAFQEEKRMPFITIAERVGMEKGLLEGIEVALEVKFGKPGLDLMPEIRRLEDHEVLQAVLRAIPAADRPEDLRRIWAPGRRSKKRSRT